MPALGTPAAIDARLGRHLDTTCLFLERELPTLVTKWHPATKLLLLAALLLVPYLFWTNGEDAAPALVASRPRPAPAVTAGEPASAIDPAPTTFVLPPLERLTAVVERPLFSPTRRMPVLTAAVETEATPIVASAPVAAGPAEPQVRFFGTARENGEAAALVTFPGTTKIGRLRPGDQVGEWQVLTVERDRLVLGLGEEQRSYELFGAGARVAPRPPAAAEAATPDPAAPPDMPDPAAPPDMPDDVPPEESNQP